MIQNFPRFELADRDYSVLSTKEQNTFLKLILSALVYSTALDSSGSDALEMFEDYQWLPRPGADPDLFTRMIDTGNNWTMNREQLDQFMDMVSATGDTHLYFWIRKALLILKK